MRKLVPMLLFTTLFAASQFVEARGGAGPSGGSHFGGPSSNGQAAANSNGRSATDRDTGLDRAEDRMSAQGKAHDKATKPVKGHAKRVRDTNDAK